MKSQTQTVQTVHGETSYETVQCDSCDSTVAKSEARGYIMGTVDERKNWGALGHIEFEMSTSDLREGYVCPYCYDAGPIGTPKRNLKPLLLSEPVVTVSILTCLLGILIGATLV